LRAQIAMDHYTDFGAERIRLMRRAFLRQKLYICTSKASKSSTSSIECVVRTTARVLAMREMKAHMCLCI
jgi:hypothetical protein